MSNIYIFLLSYFVLFFSTCGAAVEQKQAPYFVIKKNDDIAVLFSQIQSTSLLVVGVEYTQQLPIDEQEFMYLLGFDVQDFITEKQLSDAWYYINQKERFFIESIELYASDRGYILHFTFTFPYTLHSVHIHGLFSGKDYYKNAYLLQVGQPFNDQAHMHSVKDIETLLYDQGYCKAVVQQKVIFNERAKTVQAHVYIHRGPQYKVRDTKVQLHHNGLQPHELEEIEKKIKHIFYPITWFAKIYNKRFVRSAEKKLHNYLYKQGFGDAQVQLYPVLHDDDHTVNFIVDVSLPKKQQMVFFGNHFFSEEMLLKTISVYGKTFWNLPIAIMIDEIVQVYHQHGFWNATVSIKEESDRLFCVIQEGDRVKIDEMVYKNIVSYDKALIDTYFASFLKHAYFEQKQLQKSIDACLKFYTEQGFWDANIVKKEYVKLCEGHYQIVLYFDEGARRTIKSVALDSYQEVQDQIPWYTQCMQGDTPFLYSMVRDQQEWLKTYFKKQGYEEVFIDYTVKEDQDRACSLLWKIQLKKSEVTFGKTILKGNTTIPFRFIQREISYQPGQLWDVKEIEKTIGRLQELDVFESVHMYPVEDTLYDKDRTLILNIVENEKYEVRGRVGFQYTGGVQRAATYKAGGTFIIRNPLHHADKLELSGDATLFYRNFDLRYSIPWLFNSPIRTYLKAYHNKYNQPVYLGGGAPYYQALQQGVALSFDEQFEKVKYGGSFGVEGMSVQSERAGFANTMDYDSQLLGKKITYLFAEPMMLIDQRNDALNPTMGYMSLLSVKGMFDVQHQTSFFRFSGEHTIVQQVMPSLVLAMRARFGHIFNREYQKINPIERFYLGGLHSVRSYLKDYGPPLGLLEDPIPNVRGLPKAADGLWKYAPQGGRTFFNLNLEARFPLYKKLDGAIFQDFGLLIKDSIQDASDNLMAGTGFGLRYQTVIGPVRFDIAWKWRRVYKDFEPLYVWFLSLGHAF
ncbi:hypothetical protein EBQ93_02815 [bacterium]|nr:hypothetical protein [bacterium]